MKNIMYGNILIFLFSLIFTGSFTSCYGDEGEILLESSRRISAGWHEDSEYFVISTFNNNEKRAYLCIYRTKDFEKVKCILKFPKNVDEPEMTDYNKNVLYDYGFWQNILWYKSKIYFVLMEMTECPIVYELNIENWIDRNFKIKSYPEDVKKINGPCADEISYDIKEDILYVQKSEDADITDTYAIKNSNIINVIPKTQIYGISNNFLYGANEGLYHGAKKSGEKKIWKKDLENNKTEYLDNFYTNVSLSRQGPILIYERDEDILLYSNNKQVSLPFPLHKKNNKFKFSNGVRGIPVISPNGKYVLITYQHSEEYVLYKYIIDINK